MINTEFYTTLINLSKYIFLFFILKDKKNNFNDMNNLIFYQKSIIKLVYLKLKKLAFLYLLDL